MNIRSTYILKWANFRAKELIVDSFSLGFVVKSLDSHTCAKVEPAKEEPAKEGEEAVGLCVIVIVFSFFPLYRNWILTAIPSQRAWPLCPLKCLIVLNFSCTSSCQRWPWTLAGQASSWGRGEGGWRGTKAWRRSCSCRRRSCSCSTCRGGGRSCWGVVKSGIAAQKQPKPLSSRRCAPSCPSPWGRVFLEIFLCVTLNANVFIIYHVN